MANATARRQVSLVAFYLKGRVFREQLQHRRTEFDVEEEETRTATKLFKHQKRLVKTSQEIRLVYASTLVAVAECLPIGLLQVK